MAEPRTRAHPGETTAAPSAAGIARLSLLGTLGSLLLVAACSPPPMAVPGELIGTWVSDDPRYRDRTLVLRSDAIVFGAGPYDTDLHTLIGVEALEPSKGWTPYRFSFRESDAEVATLEVAYRVGATPELRLRNRDEIWRPEGSIPDPAKASVPPSRNWTDAWMVRERGDG